MTPTFKVLKAGLATIVDAGRYGYAHLGFAPNGAIDDYSYHLGNALLGNTQNDAAIEVTLLKFSVQTTEEIHICVTGAEAEITINNEAAEQWSILTVPKNGIIEIRNITDGLRVYLCVAGGFDVPLIHGSTTYDSALNLGVGLKAGMEVKINQNHPGLRDGTSISPEHIPKFSSSWRIRVCPGPDFKLFTKHKLAFEDAWFKVSNNSNSIGVRLEKRWLTAFELGDALSKGVIPGAIEITPSGQPIVLHRGRGGTIGYPVFAVVCSADLGKMGQARPFDKVKFEFISVEKASYAYKKDRDIIHSYREQAAII